MIPLLPAILLLLMQGSLNGDALEGRVQQLWLARLTGHSTQQDQATVEEAMAALLSSTRRPDPCLIPDTEPCGDAESPWRQDPLKPNSSPRDGPLA